MFRIRRVFDDTTPAGKDAIAQVKDILRVQFSGLSKRDIAKLPDELRNPLRYRFRFILFVAEGSKGRITGFALFIPTHWLCDLVWLSFVSILVYRTRSLWGRKFQEGLFITCSLLLIGFGMWFVVSGVRLVV